MSKLDELIERHGRSFEERKAKAVANVEEVFNTIFEEVPELNFVRLQGWTPGFNDGDPCTHSMYVAVDGYDPYEIIYSIKEDYIDEDMDGLNVESLLFDHPELAGIRHLDGFDKGVWNPKNKKFESIALSEFQTACVKIHGLLHSIENDLEVAYGTDWQITLTRSSNGYNIEKEHYDCGY